MVWHGPDGGDAELGVDRGMGGIVQTRHDVGHPVGVTGHPGGDDVGAVVRREGDESFRMRDTGCLEHARMDAVPRHEPAAESGGQPAFNRVVQLDDGDLVAFGVEPGGQRPAGSPAACDHDVHALLLGGQRSARGQVWSRLRAASVPVPAPEERLAGLLRDQQQGSEGNEHAPVDRAQRRGVEDGLQRGNVADARDEEDPEQPGEHQRLIGEDANAQDALLLGAHGEAVEELADDDPGLGHGQRLPVDGVGRR